VRTPVSAGSWGLRAGAAAGAAAGASVDTEAGAVTSGVSRASVTGLSLDEVCRRDGGDKFLYGVTSDPSGSP
jgi:hypothetical protein